MRLKPCIVIPTYNEADNISNLVKTILNLSINASVLIIDDNSPDGTGQLADSLAKEYEGKVWVIHREKKLGLGSAYILGFKFALKKDFDLILGMDADFSHDPKYLPLFIQRIMDGNDVVVGSRYIEGGGVYWKGYRLLLSKGANLFAKTLLNLPVHDITGAFRCYKKEALASIDLDNIQSEGFSFLEEVLFLCHKKGFKITEVPIFFVNRKKGKSKLSKKEMITFFFTIVKLKFQNFFLK